MCYLRGGEGGRTFRKELVNTIVCWLNVPTDTWLTEWAHLTYNELWTSNSRTTYATLCRRYATSYSHSSSRWRRTWRNTRTSAQMIRRGKQRQWCCKCCRFLQGYSLFRSRNSLFFVFCFLFFCFSAPIVWNGLSEHVRTSATCDIFSGRLKTEFSELFARGSWFFPSPCLWVIASLFLIILYLSISLRIDILIDICLNVN